MNFVEYITNLAPEGETALIVRQKPQLDGNGMLQSHADGTIKCTWPAFLPTAKVKPDWAKGIPLGVEIHSMQRYGK